jgi:putative flavoprotein involved in K+ transport
MPVEFIDTLVIGGGQAGLAMSYWLTRGNRPHVILERGRIAERWRSERWDSLAFQFPNRSIELPGFAFQGSPPEGFAGRDDIIAFIEEYARDIAAPVRTGTTVRRLRRELGNFVAETGEGSILAANVVVATGPYQRPKFPDAASGLTDVLQVHSSAYRNPGSLREGAILIIGAGASGAQIAEELVRSGRSVWLAVGSHRRVPRRYRGRDFHDWELALGEWDRPTAARETGEPPPLLTGVDDGHDMDLRELARMGVRLTGRLSEMTGGIARFQPDLGTSLAQGDAYFHRFVAAIDAHATSHNLELPTPEAAQQQPEPPWLDDAPDQLDLAASGISTVLWATGYGLDFGWIDAPVLSSEGAPLHTNGVSPAAGLYFLGLPWLSKRKSTLLSGVGQDAERLAVHIGLRNRNVDDDCRQVQGGSDADCDNQPVGVPTSYRSL